MGGLSTDEVLLGLGLVVVLAIGSQLVARLAGLPAIVVLLPVGFVAGILTDTVHPDVLLGQIFQPFVSLAVGVILFEAGLRLSLEEIEPRIRLLVGRLVGVGVLVTFAGVAVAVWLLVGGVSTQAALVLGAILVVSGPTVVLPLLAYARPAPRIRSLVTWEGVLVDPVGALLGVVVFHAVLASDAAGSRARCSRASPSAPRSASRRRRSCGCCWWRRSAPRRVRRCPRCS